MSVQTETREVVLSDGRVAVIRETFGRDNLKAQKNATIGGNFDAMDSQQWLMTFATSFKQEDGTLKKAEYEELLGLKTKDFTKIQVAFSELNFQEAKDELSEPVA